MPIQRNTSMKLEGTTKTRLVTQLTEIISEINGEPVELLNLDQLKIGELHVILKALTKRKEVLGLASANSNTAS